MFRLLTKARRFWMAATFAGAYAVCALLPSAVLAFSGGQNSAHCFGAREQTHPFAQVHTVAGMSGTGMSGTAHGAKASAHDHAAHGHAVPSDDPDNTVPGGAHALPTTCCGVFCVSAIAPPIELTAVYAPLTSGLEPTIAGFMSGQDPSRIDRPPRSLVLI